MGFSFRRRITLIPGVRLNISKSGVSTSIGGRGASVNIGKRGVRTTVRIPGTGISYSSSNVPRIDPKIATKGIAPSVPISPLQRIGWALFVFMMIAAAGGIIEMLSR